MTKTLIAYFSTLVAFCIIDFIWLGVVAPTFYKSRIGPLLLEKPNMLPAAIFYLLYAGGLTLFCVLPAIDGAEWTQAASMAALLGLFAYATYDLNNLATLKGWSGLLSIVDIAWGMTVSA
ncbi:MAG: DUF2177 family protein, partial [Janthinobacterium lividum]